MKIMYVTNQLFLHGGIEKILSYKLNYLSEVDGHEVILCTSSQRNNKFVYQVSSKVSHIDLHINYKEGISYFHPVNLSKVGIHFFKLRKLAKKLKPDIVVSCNDTPEQYFLPFVSKKLKTVKEFHSSGINIKKPITLLEKAKHTLFSLFSKYSALVVLNNVERTYYPFQNVHVIPNFIKQHSSNIEYSDRKKTIIAAGRIAPVKQFDHLIKAWSIIAHKVPNWEVHIYGEGEELLTHQLQHQINQGNIPRIVLKSATQQLDKEMEKASLYAMTSATECFPMVLLEALGKGLPIIAYDCPHGPGVIIEQNKQGLLIEPNNINSFAEKLVGLLSNEKIREEMSCEAQKRSVAFDEHSVMSLWNDLFLQLK